MEIWKMKKDTGRGILSSVSLNMKAVGTMHASTSEYHHGHHHHECSVVHSLSKYYEPGTVEGVEM
jgi:hypothetical protein